jgi:hypothetical protein
MPNIFDQYMTAIVAVLYNSSITNPVVSAYVYTRLSGRAALNLLGRL